MDLESVISPGALKAFTLLRQNGRMRVTQDIERLYMIELKALDVAEEPKPDVWQLALEYTV